jgi:hypothetical protein
MLKHTKLVNAELATVHGTIKIDDKGVVAGLTEEQEKHLAEVAKAFEYTKPKATVKETPKATVAEPVAEEAPKPKRKRKAPAKKKVEE